MRTLHGSRCFRVKRVRVIVLCSLPSRFLMSLLSIAHPWEEASEKNSASPLAGVGCLAEWLTQLQTQVMSPIRPTSSAARIRSTRRSTSPTATKISSCQDDATLISTTDPEGLPHSGSSTTEQQQAKFLQRSDLQASGNRWQIMCRVDKAYRKL